MPAMLRCWVCGNHPDKPWDKTAPNGCQCGAVARARIAIRLITVTRQPRRGATRLTMKSLTRPTQEFQVIGANIAKLPQRCSSRRRRRPAFSRRCDALFLIGHTVDRAPRVVIQGADAAIKAKLKA